MGSFNCRFGVSNGNGGEVEWVEALVDTGASHSVLPTSLLRDRVQVTPQGSPKEFTLADGSIQVLPVGEARFHVEGEEGFGPVVFGAEGQFLLGATTLQALDLIPDTTNHRLIPAPKLTI